MDKAEARRIASARIEELRSLSWEELRDRYLRESDTEEVTAPSGVVYQVDTQAFWDGKRGGDLRVRVAVDDGGWRALAPLTDDFILAPDGSFVDEAK